MRLILASRRSDLARIQCQAVGKALLGVHSDLTIDYQFRESLGDKNQNQPLWKMPEKGVFTEDFVASLRSGEVDAVVHSWKDLPTDLPSDLPIFGALPRADMRDLLLVKRSSLARVRESSKLRIFSSSPRRAFCLAESLNELWPHPLSSVVTEPVRGNIATRLKKLIETESIDALVVAKAALDRLMTADRGEYASAQAELQGYLAQTTWMVLPLSLFPTAPAQGALAVQFNAVRGDVARLLASIRNGEMENHVEHERKRLAEQGGGCHQKLGCSVVVLPQGEFEFLRCEKPNGEKVNVQKYLVEHSSLKSETYWSTESWKGFRHNVKLPWPAKAAIADVLLVAKAEAWQDGVMPSEKQILWTAGVETWKKLASRGIWVHGSADRQGLKAPKLDFWFQTAPRVVKLTHLAAVKEPDDLATYRIEWEKDLPLPDACGAYFFGSAFEAREFLKRVPARPGDRWYCGVGRSFEEIQKLVPQGVTLSAIWSKE